MGNPHAVGIIGLGVISRAYLDTLAKTAGIRIVAVADLDQERAAAAAATVPGARAMTVDELLADPEVETVLNLTVPSAHADIAIRALDAGKDVYSEKPLAIDMAEAESVMHAARRNGRRVGCAPDTVLGTGLQTARRAVDDGLIGRPVSGVATWISPGHEGWHPHPDFYYLPGGGPLMDMGPYYITALVHLLGPVSAVVGAASRSRSTRIIASGPRAGAEIPVEVDTHVTAILEHTSGAISTVVMSFDGVGTLANPIEVHGEAGSLVVPDPNDFEGEVLLRPRGEAEFRPISTSAGFADASRGVGLLDFATANGGDGRASGGLAMHVLEIMTAILDTSDRGRIELATTTERPTAVSLVPADEWRS